jgi:hypothetical protein
MKRTPLFTALLVFAAPLVFPQGGPAPPQPGPEHEILEKEVGTWDATVEMSPGPGAPPLVSHGVETNSLLGGMWLVTQFRSDMGGMSFEGHGVAGWDAGKKKYAWTWVDTMSTGIALGEGTWDAASQTMTGWMEGPDMTGKVMRSKSVTQWKDADTRLFTISGAGPDGKEMSFLKITYKRRK